MPKLTSMTGFEQEWPLEDVEGIGTNPRNEPYHTWIVEPVTNRHLPPEITRVGTMTSNGARFYKDMLLIEWSGPEVGDLVPESPYSGLDEHVASEFVGEWAVWQTMQNARLDRVIGNFALQKRVLDHVGNTWGYHENYLRDRRKLGELTVRRMGEFVTFLAIRNLFFWGGRSVRRPVCYRSEGYDATSGY